MKKIEAALFILACAIGLLSDVHAQSVPCAAMAVTLSDGSQIALYETDSGNLCSTFTTQAGQKITNGGLPKNFSVISENNGPPTFGSVSFGPIQGTNETGAGIELSFNDAYAFSQIINVAADPTFSQSGLVTALPVTGGGPINCGIRVNPPIPPPLVYSYTIDLGTEPLYSFTDGSVVATIAWTGTFSFTETYAGYCVNGGGRAGSPRIPVFVTGQGQGEVIGTIQ